MRFAYYDDLDDESQAIYRASDRVTSIRLPDAAALIPVAEAMRVALARDDRATVEDHAIALCHGVFDRLEIDGTEVEVLEVRPRITGGELHGLYVWEADEPPKIQVWMRTAHHARVVAFRTFLRTLVHEMCHHIDFTLLELPNSFHTQGFYKRLTSLFHQLVPPGAPRVGRRTETEPGE